MSKALVIKNADFSANKVTTITFDEEVPCTGVSFDSASVSLSSLGQASIPYTVTPSNTSDALSFASSDNSVIAVNGTTFTAVGIGTCTLTATCGSYSDTCTVTVNVVESPVYVAAYMGEGTNGSGDTGIQFSTSSKRIVLAQSYANTDFSKPLITDNLQNNFYGELAPLQIPNNATKLHVECQNLYSGNNYIYFFDDTDVQFVSGANTYTKVLSAVTMQVSAGAINTDVTIPESAKGAIVAFRQHVDYNQIFADCTTEAEVKAIVEETFHAVVSYKAS